MKWWWMLSALMLSGCASIPDGPDPVTGFEVERYMGKWYEIDRIDNRYETGLSNVTAEYRMLSDGKIEVVNRGFHRRQNTWSVAKSVAWFEGSKDVGRLRISYGAPFPGTYRVLVVDSHYRYALVAGSDSDDLWVLSREPQLDKSIRDSLAAKAKEWGLPSDGLIYVEQKSAAQLMPN